MCYIFHILFAKVGIVEFIVWCIIAHFNWMPNCDWLQRDRTLNYVDNCHLVNSATAPGYPIIGKDMLLKVEQ